MALARVKTWSAGEVLTAADLNAEFNNILNNGAGTLGSPRTTAFDLDGFALILDADADTYLQAVSDDVVDLFGQATSLFRWDMDVASPVNALSFVASATTVAPSIEARGSDSNISINFAPKGTGTVNVAGAPLLVPFNVMSYGATGDGTTDDTTAINNTFAALKTAVNESSDTVASYFVYFPPGTYRVTSTINATSIRNRKWGIVGRGAMIVGDFTSAYPILDLADSRWCTMRDVFLKSDTGDSQGTGIFVGVDNSGNVSSSHTFHGVQVYGTFTIAALMAYGSENFTDFKGIYVNLSTSATTYAVAVDGTNSLSATSPFKTINASTAVSNNDVTFVGLDARKTAGGPAIFLRRTAGLQIQSGYAVSTNDSVIVVSSDAFGHQNLWLDVHCETSGCLHCIRFQGTSPTNIRGFKFHDYSPQAGTAIFETALAVVNFYNYDIDIPTFGVNPSANTFETAANFHLYGGKIQIGDATYLNAVGHLNGIVITDAKADASFGVGTALTWDATNEHLAVIGTGYVGIGGAGTPSSKLHVTEDDSGTNTVNYLLTLTHTTSGSPANGIGAGIRFDVETSASNNEVGATIEAVTTDVTSTSEDFDLVFKAMAAGAAAAERFRIKSTGFVNVATGTGYQVAGTQVLTDRVTGFTTSSGTGNKDASAINVDTITASDANLRAVGAWLKAVNDALITHGIIGS